jgi:hypothetical protein
MATWRGWRTNLLAALSIGYHPSFGCPLPVLSFSRVRAMRPPHACLTPFSCVIPLLAPHAFLMQAAEVIRGLLTLDNYVIVVEHDLSVLDYLSDFICCLYGKPAAYGMCVFGVGGC